MPHDVLDILVLKAAPFLDASLYTEVSGETGMGNGGTTTLFDDFSWFVFPEDETLPMLAFAFATSFSTALAPFLNPQVCHTICKEKDTEQYGLSSHVAPYPQRSPPISSSSRPLSAAAWGQSV